MNNKTALLAIIVFSQFAGVSLWFLPNAFLPQLLVSGGQESTAVSLVTSLVQFGFIAGTFCFAILSIADRISPSKLFFYCTVIAASCNVGLLWYDLGDTPFYVLRFLVGFFLAGIYPIGMKIAADHFDTLISKALGLLVGALVLGTALPHLLAGLSISMPWSTGVMLTSALALSGGILVLLFIKDGPFRKAGTRFDPRVVFDAFKNKSLRKSAFGYFGHMWELYAFWAFVPILIAVNTDEWFGGSSQHASMLSFSVIAVGSLSCIIGGYLSSQPRHQVSSYAVAFGALLLSGVCCLLSPIVFEASMLIQLSFLLLWGMVVIMDSPQFSSLIATAALPIQRGTAITIVTCIGFGITIISIALMGYVVQRFGIEWAFLFLLPGPVLGLLGMRK
jgi:MFS family permease